MTEVINTIDLSVIQPENSNCGQCAFATWTKTKPKQQNGCMFHRIDKFTRDGNILSLFDEQKQFLHYIVNGRKCNTFRHKTSVSNPSKSITKVYDEVAISYDVIINHLKATNLELCDTLNSLQRQYPKPKSICVICRYDRELISLMNKFKVKYNLIEPTEDVDKEQALNLAVSHTKNLFVYVDSGFKFETNYFYKLNNYINYDCQHVVLAHDDKVIISISTLFKMIGGNEPHRNFITKLTEHCAKFGSSRLIHATESFLNA